MYSRCTHIIFLWNIYGDFGLLSTFISIYVCFIYSKNWTWKDAFQLETLRLDDTNTVTQPDCQPHKWAEKYHSARKRTIYTKIDIKKRTHRNKQANAGAVRRKQTCRRLGYRVTSTWSWAGQQHHEVRRDQTGEPCLAVTGPYAQHRPMLQNNNDYIYWQALIGCNCLTVASSGLLFNQTGSHISW